MPVTQRKCVYGGLTLDVDRHYRITGIFCGCLIFAEFCGSIEIADIKNRKILQSRYNDEIVSEVIVQSRIFGCLAGIAIELSV